VPAFRVLSLLAAATVALAAGCGGDGSEEKAVAPETASSQAAAGGQTVEMTEYEFIPSELSASTGDTITAVNGGEVPHNLTIEQGPNPERVTKELATTGDIEPGTSGQLTVDVSAGYKAGRYVIVCTIPGHRTLGMVGYIDVD
jgi:plastocyanin